jgi:hypothetical protein
MGEMKRVPYWGPTNIRRLRKSLVAKDLCTPGSKLIDVLFPRPVYLAKLRTRVHLPNICLVIAIAFQRLVYLATRHVTYRFILFILHIQGTCLLLKSWECNNN